MLTMRSAVRNIPLLSVGAIGLATALTGCVERTITITSEPGGALVYLNDREIGRTPVDVEFIHYGTYDVRLLKNGFEPLLTAADAQPPLWDLPGPDFLAEITPVQLHSDIEWHFVMEPVQADRDSLIDRAHDIRQGLRDAEADFEAGAEPMPAAGDSAAEAGETGSAAADS